MADCGQRRFITQRMPRRRRSHSGPLTNRSPVCPNSAAPKLGKVDSLVKMDLEVPDNASGVLYALAGFSGGLCCYMRDGLLCYEFNLFEIERTKIRSADKISAGKAKIEVESKLVDKIGGPMDVTLRVNGSEVAKGCGPSHDVIAFHQQRNL